jgi:type VI secretion system protein ImpH
MPYEDKAAAMTVNFMGLTGPEGVLPLWYTEFLMERWKCKDTAMADFFDIFNHRIISLFYQAWEKYRFDVAYERGEQDCFSQGLADLIGIGTAGLQKRLAPEVADGSLFYYSGLLAQRPHSAIALEQLLSDYFDIPVEVNQFAGRWYRLDQRHQTCLSEGRSIYETLGVGTVVGDKVWDQQSLIRLRLGPLTLKQYRQFLPGGWAHQALRSLTKLYGGQEFDFEAQLVLKTNKVPRCYLGQEGAMAPQLGWVTWMKSSAMQRNPEDTIIPL